MATSEARPYRSPRRAASAAETRTQIISAAAALFAEKGWTATSMRQVAAGAGVSVETIYASVGGKLELLDAVIGRGVVGDDAEVALADRPEFHALAHGTRDERFAAVARMIRGINERAVGVLGALVEASRSDERAAELRWRIEAGRRTDVARGIAAVLERDPTAREIDEIWLLTSIETYDQLIRGAGWTPDEFEAWLPEAMSRCLTPTGGTR